MEFGPQWLKEDKLEGRECAKIMWLPVKSLMMSKSRFTGEEGNQKVVCNKKFYIFTYFCKINLLYDSNLWFLDKKLKLY